MRVLWISAVVLFLDQVTKVAVLQFMYRQQSIAVLGDWLRLTFTENPGMAFGIQFGPPGTITVLALFATLLIAVYIWQVRHAYLPYRMSLAFIFGGALGNMVDRIFYGEILGYGSFFNGRVVDFIHVSLWQGIIPSSVPLIGGAYVELFPIWNVADMAIVLGVVGVLFLYRGFHDAEMRVREERGDIAPPAAPESEKGPPQRESTVSGSAPALPNAPSQEGGSAAVEPNGPRDSAPPEVPVYEDVDASSTEAESASETPDSPTDSPTDAPTDASPGEDRSTDKSADEPAGSAPDDGSRSGKNAG